MPKKVATPKQTSGGGFTFEDKVSASYLLDLLSGEPPLSVEAGAVESVRFQKRVDGWYLDDLVLFLKTGDGGTCSVAMSIKSNEQITKNGFPADFTKIAWEQRLHVETELFDISRDYLVLVTGTVDNAISNAWHGLLTKAIDADPTEFPDRIATPQYSNDIERSLFASLQCPKDVDDSMTSAHTAELLKRIRHIAYDFEQEPSRDDNTQIIKCRGLLRNKDLVDAASLWTHLKQFAREYATTGGDVTRQQLANHLRSKFQLKEFPHYAPDWQRLAEDFACQIDSVKDKLGDDLHLSRNDIDGIDFSSSLLSLVGASGSGKTALAKQLACKYEDIDHRIWLTASLLNSNRPTVLFSDLGLDYGFQELLSQTLTRKAVIVVDSVERLNQTGFRNLAALLRYARVDEEGTPWSFVFTCVIDQWERVLRGLHREYGGSLNIKVTPIDFQFKKQRATIIQAFPRLTRILQRPDLDALFGNLKVLDLVLSNVSRATGSETWVGETDILDWFWEQVVCGSENGAARSRFVQKLSCAEADRFVSEIPIDVFENNECSLAEELVSEGVTWSRIDQFGMEHDLLGDWARSRFLLSKKNIVASVISEKASNPHWHRAIRLFGLRLLESDASGIENWVQLIGDLCANSGHTTESDLILESVVFAANANSRLEQVWPTLLQSDGVLLNRLLTRFLHVGTLPDPRFFDASVSISSATHFRYPFWPLWTPVLKILFENRAEAIPIAMRQVTEIAHLWLQFSDSEVPLRDEAAWILVDSADYMVEHIRSEQLYSDDELAEHVFSRLPIAATALPDEVEDRLLGLVERRDMSPFEITKGPDNETDDDSGIGVHPLVSSAAGRTRAEPWPDGPRRSVNIHVHSGLLDSSNPLQYLFHVRPDIGKEVLLALLIREPLWINSRYNSSRIGGMWEFLHIYSKSDWRPAMFFRGPFLLFLQINPEKAVEVIIDLVNFATQRWLDNRQQQPSPLLVLIDGVEHEFFGSNDVYYWYRDPPQFEDVIPSALMALEKWLYDRLEQDHSIEKIVHQILRTSESTALLGVLVAAGRKCPRLFKHDLRDLVPLWELQVWEENYRLGQLDSMVGMTMTLWVQWGESIWNLVRDWHTLEHRKTTLSDVLLREFLTDQEMRSYLGEILGQWKERSDELGESEEAVYLEKFILKFDKNNWKERQTEGGNTFEYVEPKQVTQRFAAEREANELNMKLLTFPQTCRRIIDENKKLSNEQLAFFWLQLQTISTQATTDDDQKERIASSVMGGITVLCLYHDAWLKAEPERENWCVTNFNRILDAPPRPPQYRFADSLSNYHWDNFAAILSPRLLASDLSSVDLRRLCAECALAYNYRVTHDLMASAFEQKKQLDDDLARLSHLVLVSSGLREVNVVTHGGNSFWDTPEVPYDLGARYDELVKQFADSSLSTTLPSLSAIALAANEQIVSMVQQQHKKDFEKDWEEGDRLSIIERINRGRGFDADLLREGFEWLKQIEFEKDVAARKKWIDTIEDFVKAFLRPLGGTEQAITDEENDSAFHDFPTPLDDWIFELIATVIPKLEVSEPAQRLWEPILSIGLERVHWVDAFLSSWFISGLKVEGGEIAFFREWKEMIDFAWSEKNWQGAEGLKYRSSENLFQHLMGFSFGNNFLSDVKYLPFITAMKPEYDRWAEKFLLHPGTASDYARFLTCPSAVNHLRDGVKRLSGVAPHFEEWHWRDTYHLGSALVRLLEHDWKMNVGLVKNDDDVRGQFTTLLKTMTDRQIPEALELQDQIARKG